MSNTESKENYFPQEYNEYYYFCCISNVEKAKEKYKRCNDFLLGTSINNSPAMELLKNETSENKKVIYSKYKKLYINFINYADKLIDKENVDSMSVYIRYMKNLMRIANETTLFTSEHFGLEKRKLLKEKKLYYGEKKKLSLIIAENKNISYELNPYDIATNIVNKYIKLILFLIILIIALVGCVSLKCGLNGVFTATSNIELADAYMYIGTAVFMLIISIFLLAIRIIYREKVDFYELKGFVDSKNYFLVVHPFKNKFSFKNIMEILRILRDFRK